MLLVSTERERKERICFPYCLTRLGTQRREEEGTTVHEFKAVDLLVVVFFLTGEEETSSTTWTLH